MKSFMMHVAITYLLALSLILQSTNGRSIVDTTVPAPVDWYMFFNNISPQLGRTTTEIDEEIDFKESDKIPQEVPQSSDPPSHNGSESAGVDPMNTALPRRNPDQMAKECEKMNEPLLRDACKRVVSNPILRSMDGVRGYLESPVQFTTARAFTSSGPPLTQLICGNPSDAQSNESARCPTYSDEDLAKPNKLSLSPWKMCYQFDPHRFPQWLNLAQCLCKGCIDPSTGSENKRKFYSELLSVDISVLRKDNGVMSFLNCTKDTCREDVQKIAIGCHCAFATIQYVE